MTLSVVNANNEIENTKSWPYFPVLNFETLTSRKSLFFKRWFIFKKKATFQEILDYLKEEDVLVDARPVSIRNDMLPGVAFLSLFKNTCVGWAADFRSKEKIINSLETTLSTSIGEGLERYFLTDREISKAHVVYKTYAELTKTLEDFPQFLPEQVKRFPSLFNFNDRDSLFSCVEVSDLLSKKNVWIPTQYIFWQKRVAKEKFLVNSTTNGAGGHFTKAEAILSGIYEEIERHTFMLYWYTKKTPRKITIASIGDEDISRLISECTRRDLEVHVLLLENEYRAPVYGCVLVDRRNNETSVSFGSKLDIFDSKKAIYSALTEALVSLGSNLNYQGERLPLGGVEDSHRLKINRDERIGMWTGQDAAKHIDFLIRGQSHPLELSAKNKQRTKEEELDFILNKLKLNGTKHVYVYDVKSPILQNIGYHVTKVVIADLIQLNLHEFLATFKSKKFAKEFNKDISKVKFDDFNKTPHPFP